MAQILREDPVVTLLKDVVRELKIHNTATIPPSDREAATALVDGPIAPAVGETSGEPAILKQQAPAEDEDDLAAGEGSTEATPTA
jgi:hypothetical protein